MLHVSISWLLMTWQPRSQGISSHVIDLILPGYHGLSTGRVKVWILNTIRVLHFSGTRTCRKLLCQKLVSVGCNYLSMPWISASGTKVWMTWCKTTVTPLLMHWSYHSFWLSHQIIFPEVWWVRVPGLPCQLTSVFLCLYSSIFMGL